MVGKIGGVNKRSVQRQVVLAEYGDENRFKVRMNNCWDFSRGLKRERTEIIAEILCCCSEQKNKTDIMYKVNLNHAQLQRHLKSLTLQGLLVSDSNKYVTTKKGRRFLKLFVQLNNMLVA